VRELRGAAKDVSLSVPGVQTDTLACDTGTLASVMIRHRLVINSGGSRDASGIMRG
jgi:hypothetical protein